MSDTETLPDTVKRGRALIEAMRPMLEREHWGQVALVHVDSGDYEIAQYPSDALNRLRKRQRTGSLFLARVGPPTEYDLNLAAYANGVSK